MLWTYGANNYEKINNLFFHNSIRYFIIDYIVPEAYCTLRTPNMDYMFCNTHVIS